VKTAAVRWEGWDAVRCVAGDCELIVGVSAGPRILVLRRNAGPNLLYHDTTDFRVGDWRLHGGHRFTVAPEEERTYEPDNAPCTVDHGETELRIAAAPRKDGTRRILVISAAIVGTGFDVRHILQNDGAQSWHGALWAITCVPHAGTVVAPLDHSPVRFWPGTDRTPWQIASQHLTLPLSESRGKAGWHCAAGWLASLQREATLVIHSPDVSAPVDCADEGCNVELFTCADFIELETLSRLVTLAPGARAVHRQRWRLLAPGFKPEDWRAIGEQAGCDAAD
jgi:hypothetical protein